MDYIKSIQAKYEGNLSSVAPMLKYQPFGKLLWVKDPYTSNIIQAKCIGFHTELNNHNNSPLAEGHLLHEYILADGRKVVGSAFSVKLNDKYQEIGLYENYDDCFNGKYDSSKANPSSVNMLSLMKASFGCYSNLEHPEYCINGYHYARIRGYYMTKGGNLADGLEAFAIYMDASGIHLIVSCFEKKLTFPTIEAARATYKPKVITFDNPNAAEDAAKAELVEITIKIAKGNINTLKKLGFIND